MFILGFKLLKHHSVQTHFRIQPSCLLMLYPRSNCGLPSSRNVSSGSILTQNSVQHSCTPKSQMYWSTLTLLMLIHRSNFHHHLVLPECFHSSNNSFSSIVQVQFWCFPSSITKLVIWYWVCYLVKLLFCSIRNFHPLSLWNMLYVSSNVSVPLSVFKIGIGCLLYFLFSSLVLLKSPPFNLTNSSNAYSLELYSFSLFFLYKSIIHCEMRDALTCTCFFMIPSHVAYLVLLLL